MVLKSTPNVKPAEEFREASIDAAKKAGVEAIAVIRKGDETIRNFALRTAMALILSPEELKQAAELEGATMPNAKFRHSTVVAYLTGYCHLRDSKEIDETEKERLSKQVSYMSELTEALVKFIKTEKLAITGAPGEFEKIAKLRDETTVTQILKALRNSKRKKKPTARNEFTIRDTELLEKLADAYRNSKKPIGTFKAEGVELPHKGVAYAIIQKGDNGWADVYDVVQAKTKPSIELLREVETLPSVNDDQRLNYVLDLLFVASKACPDRRKPAGQTNTGTKIDGDKKENYRQFFFDPANDAIFVGYGRSLSLPSFKVGSLSKWPSAPSEPGLLCTQQRRTVDKVANRLDRIKQTLEPFPREAGQKWLSKLLVTPQGADGGLALQVDSFARHKLDFFRPSTAEAKWETEFEFSRSELQQLWRDHLGPYSHSKKSEKDARIATLSFSKDGATFVYPGIDPVDVGCTVTKLPKKKLDVQFVGRDLEDIVDGILALNASGPVNVKADSSGIIALSVNANAVPYEFYLATVPPGSSERSDRFFLSAKRELQEAEAKYEALEDAEAQVAA